MSMERWEPWRDVISLRDAMERLIQENFVAPSRVDLTGDARSGSAGCGRKRGCV